jgi:hypothetical protein
LSALELLPWQVRLTRPAASGCSDAGSGVAPPVRKLEKKACCVGHAVLVLLKFARNSFFSFV